MRYETAIAAGLLALASQAAEIKIKNVRKASHPTTGVTVVAVEIASSEPQRVAPNRHFADVSLRVTRGPQSRGERAGKSAVRVRLQNRRRTMIQIRWQMKAIAEKRRGSGPANIFELPPHTRIEFSNEAGYRKALQGSEKQFWQQRLAQKLATDIAQTSVMIKQAEERLARLKEKEPRELERVRRMTEEIKRMKASQKRMEEELAKEMAKAKKAADEAPAPQAPPNPIFYMKPKADFSKPETIVLIELQPEVNDGKHYVATTEGTIKRVPIDASLLKGTGFKVTTPEAEADDDLVVQVIFGRLRNAKDQTVTLPLQLEEAVEVDLTQTEDEAEILKEWAQFRADEWLDQARFAPGSALSSWLRTSARIYGTKDYFRRLQADRSRSTSMLNVLGGRAAIRETLQMQAIGQNPDQGKRTIPIETIEGVQVESHPFAEMLKGEPGGQLPLAELVPHDRFMLYVADPRRLPDVLDKVPQQLFKSGSVATSSALAHHLKDKYFDRLGIDSEWSRGFLQSGAVAELALFAPDLFFIDGTDITIVMKTSNLKQIVPLLQVIGIDGIGNGNVVEHKTTNGKSYWLARKNHLIISTHFDEMRRCMVLMRTNGEGSLGRSAEFRYMLTRLPMQKQTRGYAYFSDPFIRHLVSPRVKIGQMRRLIARRQMELFSALPLFARADGHSGKLDRKRLRQLGYLHPQGNIPFTLHEDGRCSSPTYGSPDGMRSLLSLDLSTCTEQEKEAYEDYLENYNRFWRQFFDPIAIRLNELGDGEFEAETFILPLLDSSVYQFARQAFSTDQKPIAVPRLDPAPVLTFSARLKDDLWIQAVRQSRELSQMLNLDPRIFDELGPTIHLAVMDADPVIALGSGDIFGLMNSRNRHVLGRSEMYMAPLVISTLTRPTRILVELQHPERVVGYLSGIRAYSDDRDVKVQYARVGDKDEWICTFKLFDLISLRYGVKVDGKYLVISNLPWRKIALEKQDRSLLSAAALTVAPYNGVKQLPGLHTAAVEQEREAAFRSMAHLLPFFLAGVETEEEARAQHRKLFGFEPLQPGGTLSWDRLRLRNSEFGSIDAERHPAYQDGDRDFGILSWVQRLSLSMQFEDDGLRTRVRLKLRN